jgi:hypothetical protein
MYAGSTVSDPKRQEMKISRRPLLSIIVGGLLAAAVGCSRAGPSPAATSETAPERPPITAAASSRDDAVAVRDLSIDESMGGHTLARHVGKTDADLADRLRREPEISSASTYTDRRIAERTVAAALASADGKLASWQRRSGRRPNLVLHFIDPSRQPLGRSLSRGRQASVSCDRVLVVLRWDERSGRFYVLTSYPEAGR